MNAQDLRRGPVGPWPALLILLALPAAFPDWVGLGTLRGRPRDPAGERAAKGRAPAGYYEDLIGPAAGGRAVPAPPPDWVPFVPANFLEDLPADYRRQRLRSGVEYRWNGTTLRTNRLGHRGPEVEPARPAGTFRVVLLGSSNTLGQGVDDADVYARRLEAWLQARRPAGCRAEVINLAVPSEAPTQKWARLRAEVAGLDPDWVFCDVTALDLALEELHLRWLAGDGAGAAVPPELGFVREALAASGASADLAPGAFHARIGKHLRPIFGRTVGLWAAEARRQGVPLSVLILPWPDAQPEDARTYAFARDQARAAGLPCLDLSASLGADPEACRVAPWDNHPNAEGHRRITDALVDALEADPAFLARLGRP